MLGMSDSSRVGLVEAILVFEEMFNAIDAAAERDAAYRAR